MATWTGATKNSASWTGQTKNAASWSAQGKVGDLFSTLLLELGFPNDILLETGDKILLEIQASPWTAQSKN